MSPFVLLGVLGIIGPSPGEPVPVAGDLREAEAAYRAGLEEREDGARARPHFLRAAVAFERAWDEGHRTPAVARNAAQSRLLAGDLGRCIAAYRRGLALFPHNRDLRFGLAHARSRVEYPLTGDLVDAARPRDPPTVLDRLRVPVLGLAGIALAAWALGWWLLARAWMTVRGGMALFGGVVVVAALALGAWLVWEDRRLRSHWREPTAVLSTSADLRTGNSDEYPKRLEGRLPAGVEARILGRRGGWLHIELANGTAGWVPGGRVVIVE
jgi:hypothetical protein